MSKKKIAMVYYFFFGLGKPSRNIEMHVNGYVAVPEGTFDLVKTEEKIQRCMQLGERMKCSTLSEVEEDEARIWASRQTIQHEIAYAAALLEGGE